jgi:hypothetical protein
LGGGDLDLVWCFVSETKRVWKGRIRLRAHSEVAPWREEDHERVATEMESSGDGEGILVERSIKISDGLSTLLRRRQPTGAEGREGGPVMGSGTSLEPLPNRMNAAQHSIAERDC